MIYEVWDTRTRNQLGEFDTMGEAQRFALELDDRNVVIYKVFTNEHGTEAMKPIPWMYLRSLKT